ncbi:hypothetical protein NE237_027725 [Protea cynaroides]|uniref:Transposase (putative) gypsy type domain-containing protein n=1 Tax=Protea cynaroides TaxID=273540 RepID=A0A9Q0GNI4_9MAGN|nr:hypothetical protein NE237_027725 [Protea cynaroides]
MQFFYTGTDSTLDQAEVDSLAGKYSIPGQYMCRETMNNEASCTYSLNGIFVYQEMLVSGFCLPLLDEILHIMKYYQIALGQLQPNSWCRLIAFIVFFTLLNHVPSVDLFRRIFSLNVEKETNEETNVKIPTGWYHLNSRKNAPKILGSQRPSL